MARDVAAACAILKTLRMGCGRWVLGSLWEGAASLKGVAASKGYVRAENVLIEAKSIWHSKMKAHNILDNKALNVYYRVV